MDQLIWFLCSLLVLLCHFFFNYDVFGEDHCALKSVKLPDARVDASELNNNTAHRTHNNTVSWFISFQSDSQTLTKLDEKTSKENSRSLYFFDSSRSRLLSTHVLITLFGSLIW